MIPTIRPITNADTDAIIDLTVRTGMFKPYEIETLREVLDDYHAGNHEIGHRCDLSECDHQLIGYVYYAPAAMTERTWYIYWIAVEPTVQSRGLGRQLMGHVEAMIRREQARLLLIETSSTAHYEATRAFYTRLNYPLMATVEDYYADGDSMMIYGKRLMSRDPITE